MLDSQVNKISDYGQSRRDQARKILDVLCVGDINQDIITTPMDKMPKKDEQLIVSELKHFLGGSSAITASACASLGLRTGFVGVLGNDYYGNELLLKIKSFKVKPFIKRSLVNKTDTTLALTLSVGKRSFITAHGANSELKLSDIKPELIRQARHLHVSGYWHLNSLRRDMKKLLSTAKNSGLTISFDVGATVEKRNWSELMDLMPLIDLLFINDYELRLLTNSSLIDGLKKLTPIVKFIAVHLGAKGAVVCTKDSRVRMMPHKVKVINTTGAGDVFNAGMIYGFLKGEPLVNSLQYALANASMYISRNEQRFPTFNELITFLKIRV